MRSPINTTDVPRLRNSYWSDAFTMRGAVTWYVMREVLLFTLFALVVYVVTQSPRIPIDLGVEVAPYEVAGATLGLVLVLRTNAGYDRWWEGRKLWGAITNDSRNLVITALAHGPLDADWRHRMVGWTAAFGHVTRRQLRHERDMPEMAHLVGAEEADRLSKARHMPTEVALQIAKILHEACDRFEMDRQAFFLAELARSRLIDNAGGCERIIKTPLPQVVSINIRQFIFFFLATLPCALTPRIGWQTPFVTFLVAYAVLSLDQIGVELQNPFEVDHLGHLPLDAITASIEAELFALNQSHTVSPDAQSG